MDSGRVQQRAAAGSLVRFRVVSCGRNAAQPIDSTTYDLARPFECDLKGWMTTLVARRFCAEFGLAINTIPQYLPDPPPIGEGSIGSVLDDVWAGLAGRQEKIDELAEKSGQMKEQSTLMAQNSMRLKSVAWAEADALQCQQGTGTPIHPCRLERNAEAQCLKIMYVPPSACSRRSATQIARSYEHSDFMNQLAAASASL